jgi:hypothetical protein
MLPGGLGLETVLQETGPITGGLGATVGVALAVTEWRRAPRGSL